MLTEVMSFVLKIKNKFKHKRGTVMPMEMVQVAILIALAVALGLIFKSEITSFINKTFSTLNS